MVSGWAYRIASVVGTSLLTVLAVQVANHPLAQRGLTMLPVVERLPATTLTGGALALAVLTTTAVVLGAMFPLFKPQPRRILDVIATTHKRVLIAGLALAAIGYFDYTYRLPRTTLLLVVGLLFGLLPAWFVGIRKSPDVGEQAILVGDDLHGMMEMFEETELPVLGYVAPPMPDRGIDHARKQSGIPGGAMADGGMSFEELPCLGGLSRLESILVEYDVDTVLLAFSSTDRAEFFGTLETCHATGVNAKIHERHADGVLTKGSNHETIRAVDIEPWDWQDYMVKRAFDVVFSLVGLVVLAPVMVLLALAVKLDSKGPIFYSQERTAERGETFQVYKFRTMLPESEDSTPISDAENTRITRIGRILRITHLDEIPQLWSILKGDMSVIGPRAVWTNEELHLEDGMGAWRKRWFVKPGLTGLAQINGVSSTSPRAKLRYDMEYIQKQSFWFDMKIVVRQFWVVIESIVDAK
ncbi:sugar transferase [Haladaptatus sp. GCM10025707]|uniref:sugar transferase n=1 Tax=unclassified Haladaptatus TaxID=2622732 RepID=UPI0023E8B823|nr:sugar transferase [Haladaptatus sp. QDMS2]